MSVAVTETMQMKVESTGAVSVLIEYVRGTAFAEVWLSTNPRLRSRVSVWDLKTVLRQLIDATEHAVELPPVTDGSYRGENR